MKIKLNIALGALFPYNYKIIISFLLYKNNNMRLFTSVIEDLYTLEKAKTLLYEYYIEKLKWDIPIDNYSGIRIKKTCQQKKFVDDYDDYSIWFSVTNENNNVVACARLCKEDTAGLLEIERYGEAKQLLHPILNSKKQLNLIELNREAILPDNPDNKVAGLVLLKFIFNYCLKHNYSVLTTTNIPEWLTLYNSLPLTRLYHCQFRYAETDPNPVEVYFVENRSLNNILNKINSYLEKDNFFNVKNEASEIM